MTKFATKFASFGKKIPLVTNPDPYKNFSSLPCNGRSIYLKGTNALKEEIYPHFYNKEVS